MAFPSTARNGQTHNQFGKKFSYSEASGAWSPAVPLASVAEVRIREKVAETATASYATAVELPLTGNTAGQMAFVQETNRLYVWSGTGWYNVATVTSAAAAISGANSTYTLATDGSPTVVTLSQSGLTSPTWSYAVTSSSLGRTAVVTQADNIFTITPSALAKNVGSFGLTFKATDGSNTIAYSSKFTMSNTAPVIGTAPSAAYTLASDGTPTIITLAATDADGHAITWSYEVVSGSLGGTAVSIVGSEFTITPSVDTNDAGEFQLRFIASDGVSFDAEVSAFTLVFGYTLIHSLNHPTPGTNDNFGYAADIDGNYAVITAWQDRSVTPNYAQSGTAYIFNVTTGALVHTLLNPNAYGTSQLDQFGNSASISGNYAIVGAFTEDDGPHPTNPTVFPYGNNSGKAYIFNVTTGALVHTLNNPNAFGTTQNDQFGTAVAISGNYAIFGCPNEDDTTNNNAGKAYIFNVTTGALQFTLNDPNYYGTSTTDYFGHSVAIDGSYAVVGSIGERNYENHLSGAAHIYNVTTGALFRAIPNPNSVLGGNGDQFGYSVAISGINVIVGAPYEDDVNGVDTNSGKAYIFNVYGTLLHTLNNPNAYGTNQSDYFGTAVAISGSYAMVGVYAEDDAGGTTSGKVYVYNITTGALIKTIDNPNARGVSGGDQFGLTLAMSGNDAIIGAPYETSEPPAYGMGAASASGKAYIFQTA
jgi:hypothetical protein